MALGFFCRTYLLSREVLRVRLDDEDADDNNNHDSNGQIGNPWRTIAGGRKHYYNYFLKASKYMNLNKIDMRFWQIISFKRKSIRIHFLFKIK